MKVFVDTSAWISLVLKKDQFHVEGTACYERFEKQRVQFVTTDYVLDETITRIAYDGSHTKAIEFVNLARKSVDKSSLQIISCDSSVWAAAEQIFRAYDDVQLSFTDCTSFVVMRNLGIGHTFTFDDHFRMMGFIIHPAS